MTDTAFDIDGAENAIAQKLDSVSPADVTITVTAAPDGKQKVTVSIYAADAAEAQRVAGDVDTEFSTEGQLSDAFSGDPPIASVTPDSLTPAAVQVTTHAAPSPPSPSPSPAVIAIASSPPPSSSPAPPPPPSLPDGLVAIATHTFTLTAKDTATRRRRLAQITTDMVKEKVLALLDADPAFQANWLVGEVTVTGGETADDQGQRTFDVQIVALKAHSDEL